MNSQPSHRSNTAMGHSYRNNSVIGNYSSNPKALFNKFNRPETIVPGYFMKKQKSQFDSSHFRQATAPQFDQFSNLSRKGGGITIEQNSVGEFMH